MNDELIEVVVSEFCPPGKAFIVNTALLGIEPGGKMIAFHPDQREVAERVEDLLARDASILRAHAAMLALTHSGAAEEDA